VKRIIIGLTAVVFYAVSLLMMQDHAYWQGWADATDSQKVATLNELFPNENINDVELDQYWEVLKNFRDRKSGMSGKMRQALIYLDAAKEAIGDEATSDTLVNYVK
jgi:hypothetical protein